MVSKLLLYPIILLIILNLYGFGASGQGKDCNMNTNGGQPCTPAENAFDKAIRALCLPTILTVNNTSTNTPSTPYWWLKLLPLPSIPQATATLGAITGLLNPTCSVTLLALYFNPFLSPFQFFILIGTILGITIFLGITFSILSSGAEILNAGTAYLMFIGLSLLITAITLIAGATYAFQGWPCFIPASGIANIPVNKTCANVNGLDIGSLAQAVIFISIGVGIIDTVAI